MNGTADISPGESRTWDSIFNLLGIVRHAQEGVDLVSRAAEEARRVGDHELEEFYRRLEQENQQLIGEARALLDGRKRGEIAPCSRDVVEESSMESFPASDPPAY